MEKDSIFLLNELEIIDICDVRFKKQGRVNMIFRIDKNFSKVSPIPFKPLPTIEKQLENLIKDLIGNYIFPDLLVFCNERSSQREADLFAINDNGDLVVIELKIDGHYDRGKVLQAMEYAQLYAKWQYGDMNKRYKNCYHTEKELNDAFEEHFGYTLDSSRYNREQRIIVISSSSELNIAAAVKYWQRKNIDIKEYFYRLYSIDQDNLLFELSSERSWNTEYPSCWVNTCARYYTNAYFDMIKNRKASAYGNRAHVIGDWMSQGYVFLYHNNYGIIAGGIGTRKIKEADHVADDIQEKEKMIFLNDFIHGVDETGKIIKYLSPAQIREIVGRDLYYANTIVGLSKEEGQNIYEIFKNEINAKVS